jgi:hypothetical protein
MPLVAPAAPESHHQVNSAPRSSFRLFDRWPIMSTPQSFIALMARGFLSVGSVPALSTSYLSPCRWRSSPSAFLRAGRVVGADEEGAGFGGGHDQSLLIPSRLSLAYSDYTTSPLTEIRDSPLSPP